MTEYTKNGWQVDPNPPLSTWAWPGGMGTATTRAGDATTVLQCLAYFYNQQVQAIKEPVLDDWSYNKRIITGGSYWSEHAGGTALDINATDHPYKTTAEQNFSAAQIKAAEGILGYFEGAVEWLRGWDPMHWQLARDSGGRLARIAAKVRPDLDRFLAGTGGATATQSSGDDMVPSNLYDARDQNNRNWLDFQNFVTIRLAQIEGRIAASGSPTVDNAALAAAITPSLVGPVVAAVAEKAGLTEAQVREATEAAIREVLGAVDNTQA